MFIACKVRGIDGRMNRMIRMITPKYAQGKRPQPEETMGVRIVRCQVVKNTTTFEGVRKNCGFIISPTVMFLHIFIFLIRLKRSYDIAMIRLENNIMLSSILIATYVCAAKCVIAGDPKAAIAQKVWLHCNTL